MLWSGITSLEKCLVSCCEFPEYDDFVEEEEKILGSLAKGQEIRFVGLLLRHCNTMSSSTLSLSILERTLQKEEDSSLYDDDDIFIKNDNDSISHPSTGKSCNRKEHEGTSIKSFFSAGGLKILSIWFLEAMTPVVLSIESFK